MENLTPLDIFIVVKLVVAGRRLRRRLAVVVVMVRRNFAQHHRIPLLENSHAIKIRYARLIVVRIYGKALLLLRQIDFQLWF
jgi:hypothetical protein